MLRAGALFIAVGLIAFAVHPAAVWAQVSNGVTQSPHGNLSVPCQNCHTASAWKPIRSVPEFDHNQTRYPLRGMHQSVTCTQCHVKPIFANIGQRCQDCHADIHRRQLGANCEQCHTVRGWSVSIQQIQQHNNRFPLTGAHAAVDCDGCHKGAANSQFETMSTACYSCHSKDFQATNNPNHVAAKFSTTCDGCHSTDNWLNAKFDHSMTGFLLTGGHAVPPRECTDCHVNNNYNLSTSACASCHLKDFQATTNPNHVAGNFPSNCAQCHNTTNWLNATFDHNLTNFPLTGAHTVPPRQCADCHANNNFTLTNTTCVSCHLKDFQGTTNPNHVSSNFPQTCAQCHTTSTWSNATFDHNTTGFPLSGGHAVPPRQCVDCHVNNNYNLTNSTCVSCHLKDFQSTTNPNHVASNFPQTCAQCHTTSSWTSAAFDHSTTGFPLTGSHTVPPRACTDCHINNNYNLTDSTCVSCHLKDFQSTTNPNHVSSNFPQTCTQCHNTSSWMSATFDHSTTGFPLTGSHTVPPRQCSDCHVNNNYNLTDSTCVSCHLKDFQSTTNPNHVSSNFPQTCTQCHNTSSWTSATFDHSTTGFPLTGSHTVPPRQCTDCHVNNNYNLTSATCVSCHLKDFQSTTNPNHVSGGFAQTCEICHNTAGWQPATFDHSTSGFPLTGSHTVPPRQCTDCHVNNNYNLTNASCVSCHLKDFQGTTNPNHVSSNFPQTCAQCHTTTSWLNATFDHSTTGFPLSGAHTVPPRLCTDCHVNNNYNITNTTCVSCHLKDFQGTTNPNHVSSNFPQTCTQCHNTTSWLNATFDHSTTGFPLSGSHTVPPRQCTDCHVNGNYNLTSTSCISCHQNDFNTATSPVSHTGFPTTCQQCHDTVAWTDAKFDHSTTGFTLTGAHTVPPRACADCHVNNNYNLSSTACVTCHLKDFQGTTNPNHVSSNFPQTCDSCHNTSSWLNASFDHNSTGFPLTGAHTVPPRACTDCHVNNNYNLTSAACVTCHLKDFQGTTNPNHVSSNFPQTCQQCHSTTTWLNATFDHNSTGFPLTGSHTVPPRLCTDCHVNGNYNLTSAACATCHLKDFQGTTNPNHVASNFPQTCEQCHSTTSWLNATFNHNTTGFPLTGAHTVPPRACTDCHVNGNYNLTSTACVSCHQNDYNTATTPVNHVTAHFPTTCEGCHDTVLWTDGKFDHSTTGFPLTGAHTSPPRLCTDCHVNGNYSLNSTLCYSCHQKDYTGTTNPAHAAAGFPTTCELCHDTTVWTDSTFNHNNTAFPLTGSHTVPPRQCVDCHVNGNYTTLPTACYGCHQTDYQNTTNPGHAAQPQFFPQTCQNCHTTTAWTGATFNHTQYTQFPITHGNANGVCSTCHTNSTNYAIFQCTACHGNNNAANFGHPNVSGYVYNSVNCYQCHASGGGG